MKVTNRELVRKAQVILGVLGVVLSNLIVYPTSWDQLFSKNPQERYGEIRFIANGQIFFVARNDHEMDVLVGDQVSKNITKKGDDYENDDPQTRGHVIGRSETLFVTPVDPGSKRRFSNGYSFTSPPLNLVTPGEESKWIYSVIFLLGFSYILAMSIVGLTASGKDQKARIFGDY